MTRLTEWQKKNCENKIKMVEVKESAAIKNLKTNTNLKKHTTMNARVEKVNVYKNQDIMLIAPSEEMANFASFMAVALNEAAENAANNKRPFTEIHYKELAKDFSKISSSIK